MIINYMHKYLVKGNKVIGVYKCDCCRKVETLNDTFFRHQSNSYKLEQCLISETNKLVVLRVYNLKDTYVTKNIKKRKNYILCTKCATNCFPSIEHQLEMTNTEYCKDCDQLMKINYVISKLYKKFDGFVCSDCIENYCCLENCVNPSGYHCSCCKRYFCYMHGLHHRFDHIDSNGMHVCNNGTNIKK